YNESKYLEFVFNPVIPASTSLSSVSVTHEFYRSGTLTAAKLEVWDGTAFHDVTLTLPHTSGTAGEISETKDITAFAGSQSTVKVRFLAYRSTTVTSIMTSHDLVQLNVVYTMPSISSISA